MKKRKTTVFWVINIQLFILTVFLIIFARDMLSSLLPYMIGAMIGNGAVYVGGNVLHAWQKSKYYQPSLDENIPAQIIAEDSTE